MNERSARILVLALGNDLLGDDGVGLEAARQIAGQVDGSVDVVETGEAGLALLELMEGYERAQRTHSGAGFRQRLARR
jgi:hydrogenase maturation protease